MKQTVWVKKVDSTPTQNSENLVESGGVYSELAGKQGALTFDNVPTNKSTNPVTSGGVYATIEPYTLPNGELLYMKEDDVYNINKSGRYYVRSNVAHLPNVGAHYVDVYIYTLDGGGYKHLTAYSPNTGQLFMCRCIAGQWSNWEPVMTGTNFGIVATGSTAPQAITSGQYVIWNGALYTATTNIASGATLSTSNLQAKPNGGLNALKSSVDSLNSNLTPISKVIKTAKAVYNFTIPLDRNNWVCGLLICNTNGGGNGVYYIDVMNTGTFGSTAIGVNYGNVTVIEGEFTNNNLVLKARNPSLGKYMIFDYAIWIGIH